MIRKLRQEDWQDYKALRLGSVQTDPEVYFSTYEELSKWNDGNFKAEIYSHPDSMFGYLGYFQDDRLIGYISLSTQYFAKQKHIADIFNLYVDPAYRGKGVAKELVRRAIANATETKSVEKIFLSVMSQNVPAISLYTSLGFSTYGTKHRSLKLGDKYFDETLMEFSLE